MCYNRCGIKTSIFPKKHPVCMSRNLIYLCMCTHLVRLPNQPDKFICQPCIQRQNLFQTDGSGDFNESSHLGVSGDWYSMVFYSPELH